MNERTTRKSWSDIGAPTEAELEALDAITDDDIDRGISKDPDAAPVADADWFEGGMFVRVSQAPPSDTDAAAGPRLRRKKG